MKTTSNNVNSANNLCSKKCNNKYKMIKKNTIDPSDKKSSRKQKKPKQNNFSTKELLNEELNDLVPSLINRVVPNYKNNYSDNFNIEED